MNSTYKKGAALARAGKIIELTALIDETQSKDPVTAINMGPLLTSAFHNLPASAKS